MSKDYFFDKIAQPQLMDKELAIHNTERSILNKINNIFEYESLPPTLVPRFLELYLQTGGHCCVTDVPEVGLCCFFGGWGGKPDVYYQPTRYIVANPGLNFYKDLEIGKDCVLCRNDMLTLGLMPVIHKYAVLLVENLISFRIAAINSRVQFIINAKDDSSAKSAREFLEQVEDGELGIIVSDDLLSAVEINPGAQHNQSITELISLHQYILSQLYMELGIPDNYNMKKERLTSTEANMMTDKPAVSLENMYVERCIFCDKINEMYGTNIRVRINERWNSDADSEGSDTGVQDERSDEGDKPEVLHKQSDV